MGKYDIPVTEPVTNHGIEAWALKHNQLHPRVTEFLQPLFGDDLHVASVRIIVYHKNTSLLHTSVWVAGNTIVFTKGKLNAEFGQWLVDKGDGKNWHRSNRAIDLATHVGMVTLCHELFHVKQWRERSWWESLWMLATDWVRSLKSTWHGASRWEQEAIAFQQGPAQKYLYSRREHLAEFKELR